MYEPESLEKASRLLRGDAEEFTDEFSNELGEMSGRCIDIGTGAGDVTVDFILPKLKADSTLLLTDISEAMINYGKKTYGNDKRLSFMVLDIETPNLPSNLVGQFDNLTSLYCVHWCYDLRRAFENMYSLLRPGGTAFVTFLSNCSSIDAFTELKAMPKYQKYKKVSRGPVSTFQQGVKSRQTLITLLSDIGFRVNLCSCRLMNFVFDTRNQLRELVMGISPFNTADMPTDLKAEYEKDVLRMFMDREIVFNKDRNKEDEYSLLVRYRVFVVHMKKPLDK